MCSTAYNLTLGFLETLLQVCKPHRLDLPLDWPNSISIVSAEDMTLCALLLTKCSIDMTNFFDQR